MGAYKVLSVSTAGGRARGEVTAYVVSNQPAGWDSYEREWPWVAEFPVAVGYSMDDQRTRADEYCTYLNKVTPNPPPIGA